MDRTYYNITFNDTQLDYIYEITYHQWRETEHDDDRKVLASILNTIDLADPLLGDSLETGTYHEHNVWYVCILAMFDSILMLNEQQFYKLWEKFAEYNIAGFLPDDIEEFCAEHEITVDYYIEEFV